MRYYTLGHVGSREATPTEDDDEPTPDCEGFYDDLPYLEGMVSGLTEGPVGNSRLSVDIKLMDKKGERDCGPVSPYAGKGDLHVLLQGKKDLDVKDIDLASLKFGVGKAPLAASKLLGKSNNLLLQFDLEKVGIECGRDRVLFLSGKMKDGKEILGGAPVKTKDCDKRPKKHHHGKQDHKKSHHHH